jgi:hypothetical protein
MLRVSKLLVMLPLLILLTSCESDDGKQKQEAKIQKMKDALEVTLEANMNYREIDLDCGFWNSNLTSKFILIPLNKDVIRTAVAYKAANENLSPQQEDQILQKNYQHFLETGTAVYVVVVVNPEKLDSGKNRIFFSNLEKNAVLVSEDRQIYGLVNYTTSLAAPLSPGINKGYLHFRNFRKSQSQDGFTDAYSIHFNEFNLTCGSDQGARQDWAFSFDDSEVKFLDFFVSQGLSKEDVRKRFVATPYEAVGLKADDVFNILKFVTQAIMR